jgi:hypothetical protein
MEMKQVSEWLLFNVKVSKFFIDFDIVQIGVPSWWFTKSFYDPATKSRGGILIYPFPSVRPSRYRYMVCPAISSYSFGATALIFCRMFIHIMEMCMSTGFWWSGGGIICVLQTHFIFFKSLLTKQLCP